jgi:N-acetylneuraminic acid mutarotase
MNCNMKKISLSVLFLLGIFHFTFGQNFWMQKDSVNGSGKGSCSSFILNNDGFILGGLDDFGFKRKMYSYTPSQDDWDSELSIGGMNGDGLERGSASSFSINNKGYICLGQGAASAYLNDLWEYNPETQSWTQKANFVGTARKQAVSFAINNFGYVGTGQDATGLKKDFYKYDPLLNVWTQLNDFAGTARRQAVGFSMDGNGYVGTGDDGVLKNDFWLYASLTDTWIQKATFPGTPRAGATGWGTFPTAYIATGEDVNFEFKKDVWEYNYFLNSWVQVADLTGPARKNAVSFVIDGIGYLGTGYNGVFLDDFYAYYGILETEEIEDDFTSTAYPNPANELVYVQLDIENTSDLSLQLFSITGTNVTSNITFITKEKTIALNISNLQPGNYYYELKDTKSTHRSSGKLIIL